MIERRTVFVLGAGASAPFGFPLGFGLRKTIIFPPPDNRENALLNALAGLGYDRPELEEFARALANSGRLSVDQFLEHRREFIEVGRAAMAYALVSRERHAALFESGRSEQSWYDWLFQKLNAPHSEFGSNRIGFITFNYDRSLEYYMTTALTNAYGLRPEQAEDMVRQLPIVHVYGQLGSLWRDVEDRRRYYPDLTEASIERAAAGIRIIHQTEDNDPVFDKARSLLETAERVYFLGFGYDATNLRRLKLGVIPMGAAVVGSGYGITAAEGQLIRQRHERIYIDKNGADVLAFLRNTVQVDA